MRFSQKLAKLGNPRTIRSAKRYLGRVLLGRPAAFRINPQRIIASIDREKLQQIRDRYGAGEIDAGWRKFLNLEKWFAINLRRVRELELDFGRRRSILDLGSGTGYFLYICQMLGHDTLGLDCKDAPLYSEMARLLGVPRVDWRIEPFTPLPDLGRRFDVITAFLICFDRYRGNESWGIEEWDFLLDDLARHLEPHGRIWLELNRRDDGRFLSDELRSFFQKCGARIHRQHVIFAAPPRASSSGKTALSLPSALPR